MPISACVKPEESAATHLHHSASKTGTTCRDNATEKGQYVVIYKPNSFMDDRAVWLFKV